MRHALRPALGLAGAATLAGCVEDTGSTTASNPMFPDVGYSPDVSNAAVSACRNAVDVQTDDAVEVVGSEFSQANNTVYLVVGPQRASWRCLVSDDGRVAELMFVSSEGSL